MLLDTQKSKVNEARRDGSLTSAIMECIYVNGGLASRSQILNYVQDVIDLTDEERSVTSIGSKGHHCNYFETVVGYEQTDIKNGKYPEISVTNDLDGIWYSDEIIDMSRVRIIARNTRLMQVSEKQLDKACKKELSQSFLKLPKADRQGVWDMDQCINEMKEGHLSADEVINNRIKELA